MKRMMTATFLVEGADVDPSTLAGPTPQPVRVSLATDGRYVRIEPETKWSPPILTPKGWVELACSAQALVREANAAWTSMEAQP